MQELKKVEICQSGLILFKKNVSVGNQLKTLSTLQTQQLKVG